MILSAVDADVKLRTWQMWHIGKRIREEPSLQADIQKAPEIKVNASASIGLAQWQTGESMKDVIEHADKDMYVNKEQARKEKR